MADDKRYLGFWIGHLHEGDRNRIHSGRLDPQEREMLAKGEDPWAKFRGPLPPNIPAYIPSESKQATSEPKTETLGGSAETWWGHFYIGHLSQEERNRIKRGEFEAQEIEMLAKGEDAWEPSRNPLPAGLEPPANLSPFGEWRQSVIEHFTPMAEKIRKALADAAKHAEPLRPNLKRPEKELPEDLREMLGIPKTANENRDAELLKFMPSQLRIEYDKADPKRKAALWEVNERNFEAANKREEERLRCYKEKTAEAMDMLHRLREDPSKSDLLPPEDASMDDLHKWHDKMSQPVRIVPFPGEGGYTNDKTDKDIPPRPQPPNLYDIANAFRNSEFGKFVTPRPEQRAAQKPNALDEDQERAVPGAKESPRTAGSLQRSPDRLASKPCSLSEELAVSFPSGHESSSDREREGKQRPDLILAAILFCLGSALAIGLVLLPPGSPGARLFWLFVMVVLLAACEWLTAHFLGLSKRKTYAGLLIPLVLVILFGWVIWPTGGQMPAPPATTPKSQENQPSPASQERVSANVSPEYLIGLYKKYNSAQADEVTKTYIGKWIKLSGTVADVTRQTYSRGDEVTVVLAVDGSSGWTEYAILAHFSDPKWMDRARVFGRGETVSIIGKIRSISMSGIGVENCEVVEK